MRLTKLKIAGFKSFVDPTTITFPSSLTGVVGPNGCGKSNIIDAVRWVMGEISAKHMRGDSMADVIFNGSSTRKPLGAASVELVFDNPEGKIGGAYATYNEVALRRAVSRDGTSDYFINGTKVRRKDITQLFLGTGLGSRSYAIIEQGMISRVIEARPDDLRAFLEEAAGISRYKERRRETENRIAQTRENLDRLNDLREEVEKQIRHLQRQAATARRYQTLKEEERQLQLEVLALRFVSLDAQAGEQDRATGSLETAMHSVLAELRAAQAKVEQVRVDQQSKADALGVIQACFYSAGAEVARLEQSIAHAQDLRQRRRTDRDQSLAQVEQVTGLIQRDDLQLSDLNAELGDLVPKLDAAHLDEVNASQSLERCERELVEWQAAADLHSQSVALGQREMQVEHARIDELENQQRRLLSQNLNQENERATLSQVQPDVALETLAEQAAAAESSGQLAAAQAQTLLAELNVLRDREREQAQAQIALRERLQQCIGAQVSTEALQQAALGEQSGSVPQWLRLQSLDRQPRLAQQLRVEGGWERAVETVLGSYLEAVCVDRLERITDVIDSFDGGQLTVVSGDQHSETVHSETSLGAKVHGRALLGSVLFSVFTAETLDQALERRRTLTAGQSVVTRDGVWLGADWLRLSQGQDPHSGVIEREELLRKIRLNVDELTEEAKRSEHELELTRQQVRKHEDRRDHRQMDVNRLHRESVDRRAAFDAAQLRNLDIVRRRAQLEAALADVRAELSRTEVDLQTARQRLQTATDALRAIEPARLELEQGRERLRAQQVEGRSEDQAVRNIARNLALQVESRRSSHASLRTALSRMQAQLDALTLRRDQLNAELDASEAPLALLQLSIQEALQVRAQIDAEMTSARAGKDEMESYLRECESRCSQADERVESARAAVDDARFAAHQVRARRDSVAEQLTTANVEIQDLMANLTKDATVEGWETTLEEARAKIDRLGQVNLAAIGEFKEQSERKEYLDRQCKDLTDALETLESAMRTIDRETRTRFQDTFDRVNAGLKEKFPRLFGGGHAYLELTGEESDVAGVSVMARPPGKRNSTISQLSGGEKALTAVALVFAIFELNPAPFCLLDEVDAPLDDNNVSRFCDIVRDMSRSVQFIFITHNRSTMEMASQLVGVTMNEPGVSRLVAVDVDEALRMAAM